MLFRSLRAEFDLSFALPHRPDSIKRESLLAIHIGRDPFALRLAEISGLFSDRKITPIPSPVAALMGVVSFRGAIMPVYNLQAYFDQPQAEQPRWLVIASAASIALAFHRFDGHARISPEDLLPREEHHRGGRFAREFVRLQSLMRPIVHLPTIIDAIRAQSTEPTSTTER